MAEPHTRAAQEAEGYLRLYEVSKSYESGKVALREANLSIRRGELVGLIGPNGAGKSTVLKILAGIIRPQQGTVVVAGLDRYRDHLAIRTFTAYLCDQPNLFLHFRGVEHLQLIGDLYGVEKEERDRRIRLFAELFDLTPILGKRIATYSNGQYKKLALAATFLTNARIYLLDEPETGGIDPPAHTALMRILGGLRQDLGVTIVWATQSIPCAERLCDRFAIVDDARIQALGGLDELRALYHAPDAGLEELFARVTGKEKSLLVSEILDSMARHVEEAPRRIRT